MPPPAAVDASLPNYQADPLLLYDALVAHSSTNTPLRTALHVLEGAVRLYTPSNLAVAFNGGKDATVVLHLTRAVVAKYALDNDLPNSLHCLYLLAGNEFPAVDDFVRSQAQSCNLSTVQIAADFKDGIRQFTAPRQGLCAFVMGTRKDDPHGADMGHFEPSSPGWPPFMRVNPILSWGYHDVWKFLKRFKLPYCEMYDRGYTSIGSIDTTRQNPALCVVAEDGRVSYRPAWELEDPTLERAGRVKKTKTSNDVDESDAKANGPPDNPEANSQPDV